MGNETIAVWADIVDMLVKITVFISATWAFIKFVQYRELKQRIQLAVDAHIYQLSSPEQVAGITWDKQGNSKESSAQPHTHVVEVRLKFTNKGFTRVRLFNIQVGINTMRPQDEAHIDREDGHLRLKRIFTSGNIVPVFRVKNKPIEKTSFYFIEPGVEQTISYLALITQPREIIQLHAKFSLEQKRIFPTQDVGEKGLYPQTASRTFRLSSDGSMATPATY